MTKNIVRGNNTDTGYLTVSFDRTPNAFNHNFIFKAHYCTSIGEIIEKYIPIHFQFQKSGVYFASDTAFFCIGSNPLRLNMPYNLQAMHWTPTSMITSAQTPDSTWVEIQPTSSGYMYARTDSIIVGCSERDSIYIKVDSCNQVAGQIYVDTNSNCTKDAGEPILPMRSMTVQAVSGSYLSNFSSSSTGHYNVSPPVNANYYFSNPGIFFNCGTGADKYPLTMGSSSQTIDIPIKDTAVYTNVISNGFQNFYCYQDTVTFVGSYTKTFGFGSIKINYGDGSNYTAALNSAAGNYNYQIELVI